MQVKEMQVNPQFMYNFGFIMMFPKNMNRWADLWIQGSSIIFLI